LSRRLPKFIRILGHRIGVGVIENLTHANEDPASEDHVHRAYGVYEQALPMIWLDKASGPERTKVTLVHETLHAMLDIARITESSNEEDLVGRLAPVVFSWLRENKAAIAYLQEV
jgi:Zn-dependent peptidase ImmA (M78 family)